MNAMTKLHMSKKAIETKIIDKYEDEDIIKFIVRTGDTSLFDRHYILYKKEWEAFFEAQKQLQGINNP